MSDSNLHLATVDGLVEPGRRREVSADFAKAQGADAFLILVPDRDIGVLRPARGFIQTLPGGPTWREFLSRCGTPGEVEAQVAYPTHDKLTTVYAYVSDRGGVLAFLGGPPRISAAAVNADYPFLVPLLIAENEALAAAGVAAAAQDAERHAVALSEALDRARKNLAAKGEELRGALTETARLNAELREFNATLEQRVTEEVSERLKAEESLRQAQKMEAIGQLMGGAAHDFNNLLTVIMGGLDTVKRYVAALPESPGLARARRSCDYALHASKQAATLTSRLLAFARRQPLAPKPLNINRLVTDLSELLTRTLGEHISFEIVTAAGLWWTEADSTELERALLNLAVNARDAMPADGKLTIETGNVLLGEDYVTGLSEPVSPGQYVMLAVSDSGTGMDSQTLERAFEPFFTTKEVGKGTGLGLSQVHGFIRQSNGHIKIYSELGHGTTIKLYLPRSQHHDAAAEAASNPLPIVAEGGAETILVVEDHEGLRAFTVGVLRDLGYRVVEAANGRAALQLLETAGKIDLLFTDVVLPEGINGRQLAEAALQRRPGLKVLYTTGYTRNAIVHNGRLDPGVQLVVKPFTGEALAIKVRQMLDEHSPALVPGL